MDTKPNPSRNLKIVKMEQNYIKINIYIIYIYYISYINIYIYMIYIIYNIYI